jgi:hypothetical protein
MNARPYQKRIPFLVTLSGTIGEFVVLWQVDNGRFEVGAITMRGNVACDLNICDFDVSNPIAFVTLVPTVGFSPVEFGTAGTLLSENPRASRLLLVDAVGVGVPVTVKGMVYGWEVPAR